VTNTNDFRRYSYQSDTAYLINSFDFARGSQAPKLRPQEKPDDGLKLRENKKLKSKSQLKKEQKTAFAKMVKLAAVAVICLAMIGLLLHSFALKNELTREITAKQTAIANAESEFISLQSALNNMVSMSKIDKYAVEELGMTKMRSNQIQYMDVDSFKAQRLKALKAQKEKEQKKKDSAKKQQSGNKKQN